MDAHVAKPIDPTRLYDSLAAALAGRSVPEAEHVPARAEDPIDAAALLERCLGKADLATRLLDRFVEESAHQTAKLLAAVDEGRHEDARAIAHALKGAAATVGANELASVAAEVECAARDAADGGEERSLASACRRIADLTDAVRDGREAAVNRIGKGSA